jgi:hypothetical protein
MATDIRRQHVCMLPGDTTCRRRNDIVLCDDCGRFWILKEGWDEMVWHPLSWIKRWLIRRQLRLEGGEK